MNPRILVVDDDPEFCEELIEILQDEGYEVKTANDGGEGHRLMEEYPFDLMLIDLKIPKVNGFELLSFIRNKKLSSKVFVLTGKPLTGSLPLLKDQDPAKEDKILELADMVFNKPLSLETLLEHIKEVFQGSEQNKMRDNTPVT